MDERAFATRMSRKNFAIKSPEWVDFRLEFTYTQVERLKQGWIPRTADDRHFCFFENNKVYWFRSSLEIGLFEAELYETNNGFAIDGFFMESRQTLPAWQNCDDQFFKEFFSGLMRFPLFMQHEEFLSTKDDVTSTELDAWQNQLERLGVKQGNLGGFMAKKSNRITKDNESSPKKKSASEGADSESLRRLLSLRHGEKNQNDEEFYNVFAQIEVEEIKQQMDFLSVIGKADDENIISNWLAFLLNPNQNGIGLEPLQRLAKIIDAEIAFSHEEIVIHREYCLKNKRRIDLLIKTNSIWLAIENKINSDENNGQTDDYYELITKEAQAERAIVHFIYLKPDYNNSEPLNKSFKIVKYSQLLSAWSELNINLFKDQSRQIYFEEFIKLVKEKYSMQNEFKFTSDVKFYCQNKKKIDEILHNYDIIANQVYNKLIFCINNAFPDWTVFCGANSKYIQLLKNNWDTVGYTGRKLGYTGVHFEISVEDEHSFKKLVGERVKIKFDLHAESNTPQNIKKEIEKLFNKQSFCISCDFTNLDQECYLEAINNIVMALGSMDTVYTNEIDLIIKKGKAQASQ